MQSVGPQELDQWRRDVSRPAPALLDVRDPWEHERCLIEGSVALPMSQVVAKLDELDRDRDWVVICHHGMRSMQVAMYMERSGFPRVFNLQGGVDAWARMVDPAMSRY